MTYAPLCAAERAMLLASGTLSMPEWVALRNVDAEPHDRTREMRAQAHYIAEREAGWREHEQRRAYDRQWELEGPHP